MNLDAFGEIVPAHGAAGLVLGKPLESKVRGTNPVKVSAQPEIWLWMDNEGVLDQIMVGAGYRGLLQGKIGIGDRVALIEDTLGRCMEDEEDVLCIEGVDGLCFEIDREVDDLNSEFFKNALITRLFVHRLRLPIRYEYK